MEHLQAFIGDCDKRTELAKQRLLETQEELSAEVSVKANHVHELAEEIGKKLARAEQLGEEGFVEESLKLMGEVSNFTWKCDLACLHLYTEFGISFSQFDCIQIYWQKKQNNLLNPPTLHFGNAVNIVCTLGIES